MILDQREICVRIEYKTLLFEQRSPMIFHYRKPERVPLPVNCQKSTTSGQFSVTLGLKFFLMDQILYSNNKNV